MTTISSRGIIIKKVGGFMKQIIPIICFILSVILFLCSFIISFVFVVTLIQYPALKTSGDIIGGIIKIFAYSGAWLIVSILGLPFAIISAKYFTNKIIRIFSNVEIVFFLLE